MGEGSASYRENCDFPTKSDIPTKDVLATPLARTAQLCVRQSRPPGEIPPLGLSRDPSFEAGPRKLRNLPNFWISHKWRFRLGAKGGEPLKAYAAKVKMKRDDFAAIVTARNGEAKWN